MTMHGPLLAHLCLFSSELSAALSRFAARFSFSVLAAGFFAAFWPRFLPDISPPFVYKAEVHNSSRTSGRHRPSDSVLTVRRSNLFKIVGESSVTCDESFHVFIIRAGRVRERFESVGDTAVLRRKRIKPCSHCHMCHDCTIAQFVIERKFLVRRKIFVQAATRDMRRKGQAMIGGIRVHCCGVREVLSTAHAARRCSSAGRSDRRR